MRKEFKKGRHYAYVDILLMEEILHHLGCIDPCKQWDKLSINWCRISAINSTMIMTYFLPFQVSKRKTCAKACRVGATEVVETLGFNHCSFPPKKISSEIHFEKYWAGDFSEKRSNP